MDEMTPTIEEKLIQLILLTLAILSLQSILSCQSPQLIHTWWILDTLWQIILEITRPVTSFVAPCVRIIFSDITETSLPAIIPTISTISLIETLEILELVKPSLIVYVILK